MNILSTTLRIGEATARIAAEAGSATPAAPALWAAVDVIHAQREVLDKVQKGIIQAVNIYIQIEKTRLLLKFNSAGHSMTSQWSQYLNAFIIVRPDGDTKMAVKAETSDLAPNYGLTQGYKREQTVAYKWQLKMATRNDSQQFVKSTNQFELFCGTNPNQEENTWSIEITKDKSY
jgi:hypothetical protein